MRTHRYNSQRLLHSSVHYVAHYLITSAPMPLIILTILVTHALLDARYDGTESLIQTATELPYSLGRFGFGF